MQIKVITELTATSIVTKAQMRNYLEFTATDAIEDTLIETLLKGAVNLCEQYTGEAFGQKTIEVFLQVTDLDEDQRIDLPMSPFGAMTSVTPLDVEGTAGTALVLNTGYYLNGNNKKSIKLLTQSFLVGTSTIDSYYKVRYTCGYGITGVTENIPEAYLFAIMEQVKRWYEREFTGKLDKDIMKMLDLICGNTMI